MKFDNSLKFLNRAKSIIPSASQTYSKSYKYYCEGVSPAFLDHGKGSRAWDVDGNEFIDFVLALGSVTVGYNNSDINIAIKEQLKNGISFSMAHPLEVKLAEKLIEVIPCAEMVRFVKNGSDATSAAIRLARAYTGREMIACCGYHGFQDWFIGSTTNNRGVPEGVRKLTKTFQYNNLDSIENVFNQYHGKIAALIMEPISLEAPEDNFLQKVKELAHKNGSLLIFDEVITGFRLSLGGAQAYFGVTPDLCSIGKGMANGMPLSAVTGSREIMKLIDEGVFISMTFGGETLSLAAALATISLLERDGSYSHLWSLGEKWLQGVEELIREKELSAIMRITGLAPHSGVAFSDYNEIKSVDWLSLYQQELISQGILTLGINNYCLAHTEDDVEKYINSVEKVLNKLSQVREIGSVEPFLKGNRIRPVFKRN